MVDNTITIQSNNKVATTNNVALNSLINVAKNSNDTPALGDIGNMWGDDDDY